jgi:hypothetical protein
VRRVYVTGPEVERRAESPAIGLSLATTLANVATRSGVEATFYVRTEDDDRVVGRAESDGAGGVLIYGDGATDRASASAPPPSPTGPPREPLADGRPEPVPPPPTEGEEDMGSTPAEDLHDQVAHVSAKQATIQVLKRAGGPLKTDEIAKRVLRTKGVVLAGKTPTATIGAMLAVESKKTDGLFVRTDKATYGLRGSKTAPRRRGGRKPKAAASA